MKYSILYSRTQELKNTKHSIWKLKQMVNLQFLVAYISKEREKSGEFKNSKNKTIEF